MYYIIFKFTGLRCAMLVNQDSNHSKYQIHSYNIISIINNHAEIKINQITYTESVFIYDNKLISPWRPHSFDDLQISDFEALWIKPPPILLLGTGKELHIPDMALLRPLFEKGIGVEFMNSAAASRTYNVLSAENREVAIGLIII